MQNITEAAKTVSPTSATMFDFIKKLLSKQQSKPASTPAAKTATPVRSAQLASSSAVSGVEVLSLSLRAILEKFTPDLRAQVNQMPDENTKVVLPVTTIMKQLTVGVVKMSLASLQRQAPPGVFRKTSIEEKQMVDVPLGEIFKTFDVTRLKLRPDQRQYESLDMAGLFTGGQEPVILSAIQSAPATSQSNKLFPTGNFSDPASQAHKMSAPAAAESAVPDEPEETLDFPLKDIAVGWPDADMEEIFTLAPGSIVKVPLSAFTTGMPIGNVTMTWAQIIRGLEPQPTASLPIPTDRIYPLPLKVVAPKYFAIKALPAAKENKVKVDASLPDFFGGAFATPKSKPVAATPAPIPAAPVRQPEIPSSGIKAPVEPAPIPPAPIIAPIAEPEPVSPAPAAEDVHERLKFNPSSDPVVIPEPEPEPAPAPVEDHHERLKFNPSSDPVVIPEPEPEPAPAPMEDAHERLKFNPSSDPVVIPEPEPEPAPAPVEDHHERLKFNPSSDPVVIPEPEPEPAPAPVEDDHERLKFNPSNESVVSEQEPTIIPELKTAVETAEDSSVTAADSPQISFTEPESVLEIEPMSPEPEIQSESVNTEEEHIEIPSPSSAAQYTPAPFAVGSLADLFNVPANTNWTASDLIKHTCMLEGVAGALIALEEGLVVAHQLPETFSSDSFAAFLPQIFKRIGRYVREMQLEETKELMIMTPKGPCHLFHRGKVFFAVLGYPGKTIPNGAGLIADEIAKQNT